MKGSTSHISHFQIQNSWVCNTIQQIGKKIKKIRTQFQRAIASKENKTGCFFLNYLSSSSDYIMMSPLAAAKKCNKIAFDYKGRMGIVLADFPGEGLIEYLILQNFGGFDKIIKNIDKSMECLVAGITLNEIKDNIYHSSITHENFEVNYLNEDEEVIKNNDNVYFKHLDTERFLFYHEGKDSLFVNKNNKTIFNIIGSKDNIENGEEIALIIGLKVFGGILHKISNNDKKIKNKSLVVIELYFGNKNKCLKTGYENKNKELRKGMLDLQYQDFVKKNFENYFIIIKE